jgi:YHS domain-containing protein
VYRIEQAEPPASAYMFGLLRSLIELLILISVIRSVVNYIRRLWYGNRTERPGTFRQQPPPHQQQQPGSTILQQDPVCGTYVSTETSLKKLVKGQVVHFCSPECRNRYQV